MNPERFDRFSQPQFLQRIGRERVTAMLMPFAPELLGHGIVLPAPVLPDEAFFFVLATLPQQQAKLSAGLLEAMLAIEVIEEVYPDERWRAWPVVVSEIRLRLAAQARPVLLAAAGNHGSVECAMMAEVGQGGAAKGEVHMTCDGAGSAVEGAHLIRPAASRTSASQFSPARRRESPDHPGEEPARAKVSARFRFTRKGSVYTVRFEGLPKFHLAANLGQSYIGHCLHHPNAPITAFDLERVVRPEKALVRAKDSIQGHVDAGAVRAYLRQLDVLRAQRAEAAEEGNLALADRLDEDIAAIEAALKSSGKAADAGERARVNVNKAVTAVLRQLRKGGPAEQAFGRHLEQFLSLGYECCYHQPPGLVWK